MNEAADKGLPLKKEFKFCPFCGQTLAQKYFDGRSRRYCQRCGYVWYNNPVPAAGAIIYKDNQLLLVRRKYPPREGDWSLPAGFQENDESPRECCVREVREETGLEVRIDSLFWNYRAGDDPRTTVVLILYLASILDGKLRPGDDALEAAYFDMENIPSNIAFSAHRKAITHFREYLEQGKLPSRD